MISPIQNYNVNSYSDIAFAGRGTSAKKATRAVKKTVNVVEKKVEPFFEKLKTKTQPVIEKTVTFAKKVWKNIVDTSKKCWHGAKIAWAKTKKFFNEVGELFKKKYNRDTQLEIKFPD